MKKTTTSESAPSLELVANDTGLTQVELVQANEYFTKFPSIVAAHKAVKQQENNLKGKYFTLCERLREPAEGVTLNTKEMTLILRALGEPKSRASEIAKVVSVDDKVWEGYKKQVLGFRAVLAIARGKTVEPTSAEPAENDGEAGETPEPNAKTKPVFRTLPPKMSEELRAIAEVFKGELVPTGKGFYALSLLFQHGDHGRKLVIRIDVDDVAKT